MHATYVPRQPIYDSVFGGLVAWATDPVLVALLAMGLVTTFRRESCWIDKNGHQPMTTLYLRACPADHLLHEIVALEQCYAEASGA